MKKPEKFSDYPANAVDESDYAKIALMFILRITPSINIDIAKQVALNVAFDAFLPAYTFADNDQFDDIPNWHWPELESLSQKFPTQKPLVNYYEWEEIKKSDTSWITNDANKPMQEWLQSQPIDWLRTYQRKNGLKPARTKAALAETLIKIDDAEMTEEYSSWRINKLQKAEHIEYLKKNPEQEPYIHRLIGLTRRRLDYYHTATNSIFMPQVSASRNIVFAQRIAEDEIYKAKNTDIKKLEKDITMAFSEAMGKQWRHRLGAGIFFNNIMRYYKAIAKSTIDDRIEYHLKHPLLAFSHTLSIKNQCPICEKQGNMTEINFSSEADLPPFHPACWCNNITWNQRMQERMPDEMHFEEAFKRIMKPKIKGLGVILPTIPEMIEIIEADIKDRPFTEQILLRAKLLFGLL